VKPWLAALVLALLGGGCSQRPTDDVRLRLDGAYLVVENRSGADIHHQVTVSPKPDEQVLAGEPGNRLEPGRQVRTRIAPSQRDQMVALHWWLAGKATSASSVPEPGRIRTLTIRLDDPDPLPLDELAVRACIDAHRAQRRLRADTERRCMAEAEHCLRTEAGLCASMFHGWRRVEAEARARTAGAAG
jgi:hypothetical protein